MAMVSGPSNRTRGTWTMYRGTGAGSMDHCPEARAPNSVASLLEHLVGVFGSVRLLLRFGLELSLREEFGF